MTHELTQSFTFPVRVDPADDVLFSDVIIFVSDVMPYYVCFCFFFFFFKDWAAAHLIPMIRSEHCD